MNARVADWGWKTLLRVYFDCATHSVLCEWHALPRVHIAWWDLPNLSAPVVKPLTRMYVKQSPSPISRCELWNCTSLVSSINWVNGVKENTDNVFFRTENKCNTHMEKREQNADHATAGLESCWLLHTCWILSTAMTFLRRCERIYGPIRCTPSSTCSRHLLDLHTMMTRWHRTVLAVAYTFAGIFLCASQCGKHCVCQHKCRCVCHDACVCRFVCHDACVDACHVGGIANDTCAILRVLYLLRPMAWAFRRSERIVEPIAVSRVEMQRCDNISRWNIPHQCGWLTLLTSYNQYQQQDVKALLIFYARTHTRLHRKHWRNGRGAKDTIGTVCNMRYARCRQ